MDEAQPIIILSVFFSLMCIVYAIAFKENSAFRSISIYPSRNSFSQATCDKSRVILCEVVLLHGYLRLWAMSLTAHGKMAVTQLNRELRTQVSDTSKSAS